MSKELKAKAAAKAKGKPKASGSAKVAAKKRPAKKKVPNASEDKDAAASTDVEEDDLDAQLPRSEPSRPSRQPRSPSRSRSPVRAARPPVAKFNLCTVVPYWKSNKTVGLKLKSTGKQIISCSLHNDLVDNLKYCESMAALIDGGADVQTVIDDFEARRRFRNIVRPSRFE
jgi:hypothetical protein